MPSSRAPLSSAAATDLSDFWGAPPWATAAFSGAADTTPMELELHIDRCIGSREPMFGLRCVVDAVHGFIAPRFVTTLVAVGLAFGVLSLVV